MICKRCCKAYSEEFAFCPYCGKKNESKKIAKYTNGDFLVNCSHAEFNNVYSKLNGKTLNEAFEWLHSPADQCLCYGIESAWSRRIRRSDGSEYTFDSDRFIDLEEFVKIKDDEDCFIKHFAVAARELQKNDIKKFGVYLFATREECENKLKQIMGND